MHKIVCWGKDIMMRTEYMVVCIVIAVSSCTSFRMENFIHKTRISVQDHFHWKYDNVASKVLFCPICCIFGSTKPCFQSVFSTDPTTICCLHQARPFWFFPVYEDLKRYLSVTYNGTSAYITKMEDSHKENIIYILKHHGGELLSFPDNICTFPVLVEIDLNTNKLQELENLSCLEFLDTLELSHNRIKRIEKFAFVGMSYLRFLSLSNNLITYVQPGAFKYSPRSLTYIYLDGNLLITIDISNLVLGYYFRSVNYKKNYLSAVTNALNWTGFVEGEPIGGGWIDVTRNNFSHIPSLSQLGFNDMTSAMKGTFNYQLFLYGNPFFCDCFAYDYLVFAASATMNFDGLEFECANPPILRGYTPRDVIINPSLLDFCICNITLQEKCPQRCYCFNQPSKDRVVVNCSLTDRMKMSKLVPDYNNLDIDYSHNKIQSLQIHNYLYRAIKLDLSYNRITVIDSFIFRIRRLEFINLAYNEINELDRSTQLKNPCNVWLGALTLAKCMCKMRWIQIWLERPKTKKCHQFENKVTCAKGEQIVDILSLSDNELCPVKTSFKYGWLSVPTVLLLTIVVLYYNFRYETKLLIRTHLTTKSITRKYDFDLYLSFDLEHDGVRKWVVTVLNVFLEHQGYTVCIPYRNFDVGGIYVEQINGHITTSESCIILLSQSYLESDLQSIEFNKIWNTFMSRGSKEIIIINYDILTSNEVQNRKRKALLRLGYAIDFSNFSNKLLNNVRIRLSPPNTL